MMNNEIYKNKYIKYKNRYIELKKLLNQYGGKNIISENKIKEILTNIVSNSFGIFDIDYSEENIKIINNIKINKTNYYDYYGSIDNFMGKIDFDNSTNSLTNYVMELGDNDLETVNKFVKIVKNLTKVLSLGYKKDFFWLTIRTVLPNENYIIPRWHCDGNYFNSKNYTEPQTKFVTIFKGPGTLLIEKNNDVQETYKNYIWNESKPSPDTIDGRINLDIELKERGAIIQQLNNKQGLIFLSGDINNCTIHSEPNMTEPRMFLSIVFADEQNIYYLKNKKK